MEQPLVLVHKLFTCQNCLFYVSIVSILSQNWRERDRDPREREGEREGEKDSLFNLLVQ